MLIPTNPETIAILGGQLPALLDGIEGLGLG
jgi:hypothetical protein